MCGIAGILSVAPDAPPATAEEARAMAARLRHRGPDALDAWVSPSGRCALGHTRLRVIDLETGQQPMGSDDGAVQVVFNGEIYNFRELRRELEGEGHRFRTRSDTEVLIHGWRAWGEALVERLDGMFAFALWDEPRRTALLARDRAGKKPLFWTRQEGRVAFASEMKALFPLPWVRREMDPSALPLYLAHGFVPGGRTFFREVEEVPPATLLVVEADGAPRARRYWHLDWGATAPDMTEGEAVEGVRSLLAAAVERRLVSDVPLGAFLSGGIDSTLVVGLMRQRVEGRVRTFSLGFPDDPSYDETAEARETAARLGTAHTEFHAEAGWVSLVDDLVALFDQPFADSSAIPTYLLSRLARGEVTVALTGDGGDELFCGYERLAATAWAEGIPGWVSAAGKAVTGALPHQRDFRHPVRRAQRFFASAALPGPQRLMTWAAGTEAPLRLLRPEVAATVEGAALASSLEGPWTRASRATPLTRALAANFETYLPGDLLVKADRCSMAHGLELRSPFLDTALMAFAATLPDRFRVRGRTLKWLLRRAFPDLLTPEVAGRRKRGFGVPLPLWFRTHWRGVVEERLLPDDARIWAWLSRDAGVALWREHREGRADHGHLLWSLLVLESWLQGGPRS